MTRLPDVERMFDTLSARLIGFDQLRPLIDATMSQNHAFPPYDIIKTDEDSYMISIAVAGYQSKDVTVSYEKDTLTVIGEVDRNEDMTYLHEGIAKRRFERRWNLGKHIEVKGATLDNGLLNITLTRNIPEEEQPKMIPVQSSAA